MSGNPGDQRKGGKSSDRGPAVNSPAAIRAAWDARVEDYRRMLADPEQRGLAAEIELAAFQQALPVGSGLDLMDAGCGVGFHGRQLLRQGHRVTFVDVSPKMLKYARQAVGKCQEVQATFQERDLRHLDGLPDGSFDGIIAGGTVLSDCGGPSEALRELARVLRPQGILGFSVRNLEGPSQKGTPQEVVPGGGPGFDWWFFSVDSARVLCGQSGLALERAYPVLMEPPSVSDGSEYVRRHLQAQAEEEWRPSAYELFLIARKGMFHPPP